jgi:hypothetical protein
MKNHMALTKYLVVFVLLLLPVALATTVTTSVSDKTITISGSCTGSNIPVGLQVAIGNINVLYKQITSSGNSFSYSYSSTQDGQYAVFAACNNEAAVSASACVGSSCSVYVPPSSSGGSSSSKKTSSGSSAPASCQESWTCSGWSDCINGKETRTCKDDRACGTAQYKPVLSRTCEEEETYTPASNYVAPKTPEQLKPPKVTVPTLSIWDNYRNYILGGIAFIVLVLIVLLLIFVLHRHTSAQKVYDIGQLKEWIQKERGAGTSDENIREILSKHTGWKDREISQAFSELRPIS